MEKKKYKFICDVKKKMAIIKVHRRISQKIICTRLSSYCSELFYYINRPQ